MYDLAILNGQVYIDGSLKQAHLYINGDHIVAISSEIHSARDIYDAKNRWVLPGFIDPHVHFELNLGTRTSADDFYTGSIAGAYGGITTFIDFLDPISSGKELEEALLHRNELAAKSMVDYRFHCTVKNPKGEVSNIIEAMENFGLNSVKLFTTYSDSGRRTYDTEILQLLEASKAKNFVVLAHIEKDELINMKDEYKAVDLPLSRPENAETMEALTLAGYAATVGGHLYMVHLSSGVTLEALLDHYRDVLGENLWIETCPHYSYFNETRFDGDQGHLFTMAPPLRPESSRINLTEHFKDINTVGTDHCSFMRKEKDMPNLADMPMGIGGIEHSFNLMYAMYGIQAIDKMTVNPAKIFGLYPKKGTLEIGSDADIVIYDPNDPHKITSNQSASDYNVYEGIEVPGTVESTICKGQFVVKRQALVLGSVGHFVKAVRE